MYTTETVQFLKGHIPKEFHKLLDITPETLEKINAAPVVDSKHVFNQYILDNFKPGDTLKIPEYGNLNVGYHKYIHNGEGSKIYVIRCIGPLTWEITEDEYIWKDGQVFNAKPLEWNDLGKGNG